MASACAARDAAFNAGDAAAVSATHAEDAIFFPATHDVTEA